MSDPSPAPPSPQGAATVSQPRLPTLSELASRLAAIADLHSPSVGGLCSCCLLGHPCTTYVLTQP